MEFGTATPNRTRRLSSFHLSSRASLLSTPAVVRHARPSLAQTPHSPQTPAPPRHVPPTPNASNVKTSPNKLLTAQDIATMYSDTIRLCQHNKINAKNTWSLNLIDYMGMLVRSDINHNFALGTTSPNAHHAPQVSSTNFQLAGVTLDAGVRIYCSRVDSVHSSAFRVLGGLSRTTVPEQSEEEQTEHTTHEQQRKRRARAAGATTLESNLSLITVKKLETDLAVDPLFHKMSAAFDEGGARGMLLNNLPIGANAQIVFDSAQRADVLIGDNQPPSTDAYPLQGVFPAQSTSPPPTLCPHFLSFYHAQMAHASVQHTRVSTDALPPQQQPVPSGVLSECTFEYEEGDMQVGSALGILPHTTAEHDHTQHVHTMHDHDPDDYQSPFLSTPDAHSSRLSLQSNVSLASAALTGKVDLVEAGVALRSDSDYAFFDTNALPSWAGPQHWRFRGVCNRNLNRGKQNKRARSKTALLLDFSVHAPEIDFAAHFAPAKSNTANQLTAAARASLSEKKVTLPDDLHYTARHLTSLFLKPHLSVVGYGTHGAAAQILEHHSPQHHQWYHDDDDASDAENMYPNDTNMEADDTAGQRPSHENTELGIHLVPEPTQVDRVEIPYATVAKKVDVRKLKSQMWHHLCGANTESLEEPADNVRTSLDHLEEAELHTADADVVSAQQIENEKDIRSGASQTLSQLVGDLPTFVCDGALPDVSLPYVFICLLHLANEKTLSISQVSDNLRDVVITQDAQMR